MAVTWLLYYMCPSADNPVRNTPRPGYAVACAGVQGQGPTQHLLSLEGRSLLFEGGFFYLFSEERRLHSVRESWALVFCRLFTLKGAEAHHKFDTL